jgi:arsenite methyltransferase
VCRCTEANAEEQSLFDRCWWLYAVCREHLFADHTEQIARAFHSVIADPYTHASGLPRRRHLLEVGCGPGFYSRRFAALFPHLEVTGIDTCEHLLTRARNLAARARLGNCRFLKADALSLAEFPGEVDAILASRLFLILANRDLALRAMFRTLRPGGICFVAEPTSITRAQLPLWAMRRVAALGGARILDPTRCEVLSGAQFQHFIATQPWREVRLWQDRRYQYALCEKAA